MKTEKIAMLTGFFALLIFLVLTACGERREYDETDNTITYETTEVSIQEVLEPAGDAQAYGTSDDYVVPVLLCEVLERAATRREQVYRPGSDTLTEHFIAAEPYFGNVLDFLYINDSPYSVSVSDAVADVEDFFRLMSDTYPGYIYFGGDSIFYPVKEAILHEIESFDGHITQTDIIRILQRWLAPIIIDHHFTIGGQSFGSPVEFYIGSTVFERVQSGFRSSMNGLNAVSFAGKPIEEGLQLFVNESGGFYYRLVVKSVGNGWVGNGNIVFQDGTVDEEVFRRHTHHHRSYSPPGLRFADGIPIVSLSLFGFAGNGSVWDYVVAASFFSYAEVVRDEPVLIVDIRSNGGGFSIVSQRWMQLLAGEAVPTNNVWLRYVRSDETEAAIIDQLGNDLTFGIPEKYMGELTVSHLISEGLMIVNYNDRDAINREQLLIILTDRGTASTAEYFADQAMNLRNSLIT